MDNKKILKIFIMLTLMILATGITYIYLLFKILSEVVI